mgnify:CR=1 FL=1|tara:strand:+ start:9196 stop:10026 length:831 start_codon:yes stop_codon:yes gene_type:complete
MKVCLVGYEGSKKIISASSYLINKYLPKEFDVYFLNYGKYEGDLINGSYIELDTEQKGGFSSWSKYLIEYLSSLKDKFIVFSLDDYLLSKPLDKNKFNILLDEMKNDLSIGSSKLGISPTYRVNDYDTYSGDLFLLKKTAEYSATTQYNIWDRKFLIEVLYKISSPWEFEGEGSSYISNQTDRKVIGSLNMPLRYPEPSSLSSRHPGQVNVFGNHIEDIEKCISLGYLNEDDLIMGQWGGYPVKSYIECKHKPLLALEFCPPGEREYYSLLYYTIL